MIPETRIYCWCGKDMTERAMKDVRVVNCSQKCGTVKWMKKHPKEMAANYKRIRRRLKLEVMQHYGGKCVCCGESTLMFLTIDHKNNDGAKQRREIPNLRDGSSTMYYWIRNNGYPSDLQVMCYNCNCGRGKNGGVCPHEELRVAARVGA